MKNRNWLRILSHEIRVSFISENWNAAHLWCDKMNIAKEYVILNQEFLIGLVSAMSRTRVVRGF